MNFLLTFLYILTLGDLLNFPAHADATTASFDNKRAILDGDISLWTNKEEIDERIRRIKAAGFNVYMPAVWYGRGTTWPSQVAPWDFSLSTKVIEGYDPLRYAIAKAHESGIEVHPWFTLCLRWNDSFMPEYGLDGVKEGPHSAFDVHNPLFREFMTRVVTEVAANYEIDGINLDFGRAVGLCRSLRCQQEYRELYKRNLTADSLIFVMAPKTVPTLIEYQETAVTALIKSISDSVRKLKPTLLISADGHPELVRYEQGQNTIDWANKGLIDVILQMDYHPTINSAATELVKAQLATPKAVSPLISNMAHGADLPKGSKPFARSGKWLSDTIAGISAQWPSAGVAVYFYKYLSDDQIAALKAGPFRKHNDTKAPSSPASLSIN